MEFKKLTKSIILPVIGVLCMSSCKKEIISLNNANQPTSNGTSVKLSEDELIHKVTYNLPAQNVKTTVDGNTLKMLYTEDVTVLLDPKGYDLSFNIQLNEDFSKSALGTCNYTLPAPNGLFTTNWAGNNLKVLNEVTKNSVTVDGKEMIKLHLIRYFTFTKKYATAQEAVNQQNVLLNTKTDVVKFNTFVVFEKEYPVITTSAILVYSK